MSPLAASTVACSVMAGLLSSSCQRRSGSSGGESPVDAEAPVVAEAGAGSSAPGGAASTLAPAMSAAPPSAAGPPPGRCGIPTLPGQKIAGVVTFEVVGPSWGTRSFLLEADGMATYGGNIEDPVPGARLPGRECRRALSEARRTAFARIAYDSRICEMSRFDDQPPPAGSRWMLSLCVDVGRKCEVIRRDLTWQRDPRLRRLLGAIEALVQDTCAGEKP